MDTKKNIKLLAAYEMMKVAYATVLREMLVDWVAKTDNDLDDHMVAVFDALFSYKR